MPILTSPVGLVGLGLMGEVYAPRLITAGFDVVGFDVDATRNEQLLQIGGHALLISAPRLISH
jgi:3-hydroxyisobutyrate dehydrogenase-like beta-hydroxyacid dehydrogenase